MRVDPCSSCYLCLCASTRCCYRYERRHDSPLFPPALKKERVQPLILRTTRLNSGRRFISWMTCLLMFTSPCVGCDSFSKNLFSRFPGHPARMIGQHPIIHAICIAKYPDSANSGFNPCQSYQFLPPPSLSYVWNASASSWCSHLTAVSYTHLRAH